MIRGDIWLISADVSQLNWAISLLRSGRRWNSISRDASRAIGQGVDGPMIKRGPLPIRVLSLMRNRPWGEVDGVSRLPEPIPPKKPIKTWMAAIALFALSIFLQCGYCLQSSNRQSIALSLIPKRGYRMLQFRFDVDDRSTLHILFIKEPFRFCMKSNLKNEKGMLATKDGRYFVRAAVDQIVVVSDTIYTENWDSIPEGLAFMKILWLHLKSESYTKSLVLMW